MGANRDIFCSENKASSIQVGKKESQGAGATVKEARSMRPSGHRPTQESCVHCSIW